MPKWQHNPERKDYIRNINKQTKLIPQKTNSFRRKTMFIQDLNHLEVVNEETNVEGGLVFADANALANFIFLIL